MLQHISDESFFNMALDALSNGLKYVKNLVFSGLSKWNQDIYTRGMYAEARTTRETERRTSESMPGAVQSSREVREAQE